MILERVENDQISKSEELEEDSTSSGTRYKVRRDMAVSFQVYDLESGLSVYSGLISNDLTHSRSDTDMSTGDAGSIGEACANMFMSCLVGSIFTMFDDKSEEDGYPAAPTTEEISKDIFEKFAETLPAPGSG